MIDKTARIRSLGAVIATLASVCGSVAWAQGVKPGDPMTEDNIWWYFPSTRRVRRSRADTQSDATNTNNIDPDSYSGFAAKVEDFNYRLLGVKPMLAVAHAANLPAPDYLDPHEMEIVGH